MSEPCDSRAKFIPVKEAAEIVGYTTDYVARLARQNKVEARKVGRQWFVDRDSLKLFCLEQETLKQNRQQELKQQRLQEKASHERRQVLDNQSFDHRVMEWQVLATTVVTFLSMIIVTSLSYTMLEARPSADELTAAVLFTAKETVSSLNPGLSHPASLGDRASGQSESVAAILDNVAFNTAGTFPLQMTASAYTAFTNLKTAGSSAWSDMVCGFRLLFNSSDECLTIPVVDYAAVSPDHNKEPATVATSTKSLVYTSPIKQFVTNNYITNPIREVIRETIVQETIENVVTETRFETQADRTYDSLDSLQRSIAENVTTELLVVSGNTTLATTTAAQLTTTGALTAGSYSSAPYFTATDAAATSTFSGALTVGTTSSYATLTLDGAAYLASTTAPVSTTNRLYNQGGLLYWNGSAFAGASVGTWTTDGTNVWRAGGKVGIGTTTPAAYLNILGTSEQLRLAYDTSNYWTDTTAADGGRGLAAFGTDADLNLDFSGATDGDFSVNGNDLFVDTSSGFVGIGTTTPSYNFTVAGNTYLGGSATTTGSSYIAGGLGIGVSTTTSGALQTSGDARIGGNLTVVGNSTVLGDSTTIGTTTSGTLAINSRINSDLIPQVNATYDLGSVALYWGNAYVDTLTVNSISAASTTIAGTQSNTFTLNSDNATADTEDISLIFYRGAVVPNALITWDSTLDRFDINQPFFIQNDSSTTTIPTLQLYATGGQTADVLSVASSSGTNFFNVGATGNVGIGSSTPSSKLTVNGDTYIGGNLTSTGTTTLATTTGSKLTLSGAFSALSATITNTISAALASVTDLLVSGTATTTDLVATNSASLATTTADNVTISGATTLSAITGGLLYANGSGSLSASSTIAAALIEDAYVLNSGDTMTGTLVLPNSGLQIGSSVPFSDAAGTLTLQNIDALDATSETTIEAAIDTLANLTAATSTDLYAASLRSAAATFTAATSTDLFATTLNLGNALTVTNGGTGATTLTGLLVGNGTSAFTATTTSLGLASVISDETGTGSLVFANSPSLTTPDLGTPSAATLTNATGLPVATGISGLGAGIASWLATPSSANLATAVTDETGTGSLVFSASPTFTGTTIFATASTTNAVISNSLTLTGITSGFLYSNASGAVSASSTLSSALIEDKYLRNDGDDTTTGQLTATNFVASSATATSTFAGGLAVDTNGLVYDWASNRVGIGTLSPTAALDVNVTEAGAYAAKNINLSATGYGSYVYVNNTSSAINALQVDNSSGGIFTVLASGNVGIGTTTPAGQLHIQSAVGAAQFITAGPSSLAQINFGDAADTNAGRIDFLNSDNSLRFVTLDQYNMTIDSTGQVGIGTTSPLAKLHLNTSDSALAYSPVSDFLIQDNSLSGGVASMDLVAGITGNSVIRFSDTDAEGRGALTYAHSSDSLAFSTAATTQMTIDSSGNVGIGTTTPDYPLVVAKDQNTTTRALIANYNAGSSAYAGINFGNNSASIAGALFQGSSAVTGYGGANSLNLINVLNASLTLGTNNSVDLLIDSSGNVGIGTTSPYSKLDVAATGLSSFTSSSNGVLTLRDTSDTNGYFTALDFSSTAGAANGSPIARIGVINDTSAGSRMYFGTSNTLTGITNTAMVINTNGNVGIGTTSPEAVLSVNGDSAGTNSTYNFSYSSISPLLKNTITTTGASAVRKDLSSILFGVGSSNVSNYQGYLAFSTTPSAGSLTEAMRIDKDGNVGIGTTTPGAKFVIADNTDAGVTLADSDAATDQKMWNTISTGGQLYIRRMTDAYSGYNPAVVIDNSDNVGIGTVSPAATLHITGTSRNSYAAHAAGYQYAVASDDTSLQLSYYSDATTKYKDLVNFNFEGNVGIGDTSPASLLTVGNGDLFQVNSSGNVGIGIAPSSNYNLYAYASPANTSGVNTGYLRSAPSVTSTGSYFNKTLEADMTPAVSSGITNNGYAIASHLYNLTDANLAGTLASQYGQWIQYGAYTGTTGTITNSYGMYIQPYQVAGTITNRYSLLLGAPSTGGTVTNQWALYSADTADSYFAGNVGIGINAPGALLQVGGTASAQRFTRIDSSGLITARYGNNGLNYPITAQNNGITAAGHGTGYNFELASSNGTPLDAARIAAVSENASYTSGANQDAALVFYTTQNGTTGERMRIDSTGMLLPGADNTKDLGSSSLHWSCLYYDATNLGTCSSDARLKENIADLTFDTDTATALEKLTQLQPRTFTWISDASSTQNYGLIAQEVLQIAPELVEQGEDGYYKVRYGYLQYLTLQGVQELNLKVEDLASSTPYALLSNDSFVKRFFDNLIAWFADTTNGIGEFFASSVHTDELCVGEVCVDQADFLALVNGAGSASSTLSGDGSSITNIDGYLCLGNTCVDEDGLRALLRDSNVNVVRPDTINNDQNTSTNDQTSTTTSNSSEQAATSTDTTTATTTVTTTDQTGDTATSTATSTSEQNATSTATTTDNGTSLATTTPDTIAPVVTLNGGASMTLTVGDTFADPGATAEDDVDGDLTADITVSGEVDTAIAGTYTLTYSVSDSAGNEGTVELSVTVEVAPEPETTATSTNTGT